MKTIIQVVQHLSPGGIEVMALEMLKLRKKDTRMLIVSLEGQAEIMLRKWSRLESIKDSLIFLNKSEGHSTKTLLALRSLFVKERPIAVHTHHIGPLIYAGLAARICGVKNIIHTEHDAWHLKNMKRRILERNILKLVRPIVIADSKSVKHSFESFIPNVKASVILNGVDTEKFSPGEKKSARLKLDLPTNKTLIGCAGRLEKVKGQHILIRALSKLPSNYCLTFAGSGSEKETLINLVHSLDLHHRVFFLGLQEDMVTFYQALDVFCLPSYNEGMPLAPLEAQSCDIPSVLTAVGGCEESMCPVTGALVPSGSPKAISSAIHHVTRTPPTQSPRDFVVINANARIMTNQYQNLCLSGA